MSKVPFTRMYQMCVLKHGNTVVVEGMCSIVHTHVRHKREGFTNRALQIEGQNPLQYASTRHKYKAYKCTVVEVPEEHPKTKQIKVCILSLHKGS